MSHALDIGINPLPDDKILVLSKLKAFADDSFIVPQMVQFLFNRVVNIMGKEENAGYQHFLLSFTMFSKGLFLRRVKSNHYVVDV